ncbi:circadian clock KaiB family protein [Aquiflexum sp. TKW24L]|uniref:circadian clock KaiB family protein n=1 Tax=Aquiflexum sp. TKW24L TaxID=2942212 RepID=UPI0020C0A753|nr:circadian clock KaiB family protein [Aquiflexum sp. TKW24L]MCL6258210.1 circadian clock KaiB family protein [Aquiflexum sp. TKW24L]
MKEPTADEFIVEENLVLTLYISGMSQKSMEAIDNLKWLCDKYLKDSFELEIVDIYKDPKLASEQHIVFSPSLLKKSPLPKKTLIGTLSDTKKVLQSLGIKIKK